MEHVSFEGVNLAELLPRIPSSVKDALPFGLVKLDLIGNILEYNMAEGDITGVDPRWAVGKNFFDEVAICTKTPAFYGRFVEGVKKGFVNTVFDYTFDHREVATRVTVRMVSVPDHLGRKNIMILVKRADKPVIVDAYATPAPELAPIPPVMPPVMQPAPAAALAPAAAPAYVPTPAHAHAQFAAYPPSQPVAQFAAPVVATPQVAAAAPNTPNTTSTPSISDIVAAVMAAMNLSKVSAPPAAALPVAAAAPAPPPPAVIQAMVQAPVHAPIQAPAFAPAYAAAPVYQPAIAPPDGGSRHEDIIKF